MTISGSLANSLSGLTAASRAAELVSSNVANAMTEGYGRREVVLTPRSMGDGTAAGVNVTGVRREVDNVPCKTAAWPMPASGTATPLPIFTMIWSRSLARPIRPVL